MLDNCDNIDQIDPMAFHIIFNQEKGIPVVYIIISFMVVFSVFNITFTKP